DGTIESSQVFVHDNGQIVLDFQKTGTAAASNSDLANRYLWGTNVDELLADEAIDDGSEDDNRWALTDHLNSVRDLVVYNPVSGTVSVVKHVAYDAFGNVASDSATAVKSLFLYTARPFDADTDIQNNLNRWYDLSTGRWMSVDPIGFEAGDVNLYRYVGNEPISLVDPTGLQCTPKCKAIPGKATCGDWIPFYVQVLDATGSKVKLAIVHKIRCLYVRMCKGKLECDDTCLKRKKGHTRWNEFKFHDIVNVSAHKSGPYYAIGDIGAYILVGKDHKDAISNLCSQQQFTKPKPNPGPSGPGPLPY
ncbi:MAG: RHS repeat-associated core domain-containing protein, partial [Deltaproteobacteria bacterium]|nr:RHS repeat-associated core domain-containing protein [Deltaproteobacteria bacterium]